MIKFYLTTLTLVLSGCAITRAESNYELHRLAGMPVPDEKPTPVATNLNFKTNSGLKKDAYMPARLPPVVERVWIFDRQLGDFWQQGTWVWLEVEQSKWLSEVDPGGASLTLPR